MIMETVGAIQETYDIWSWLLPLISGAIGALIGTYGGSYFLHKVRLVVSSGELLWMQYKNDTCIL